MSEPEKLCLDTATQLWKMYDDVNHLFDVTGVNGFLAGCRLWRPIPRDPDAVIWWLRFDELADDELVCLDCVASLGAPVPDKPSGFGEQKDVLVLWLHARDFRIVPTRHRNVQP